MDKRSNIPIESPGINVAVVRKESTGWRFLLLKRADSETYPGFWGLVTGGREGNETVPQLARRELAEETGLVPQKLWASEYCLQFYEPTVDRVWILPVIVACVPADSKVVLSSENSEFRWLTAAEAIGLVLWQNLKATIANLDRELAEYPASNWVELTLED
jgi:dATP pyrophosphohydrolase